MGSIISSSIARCPYLRLMMYRNQCNWDQKLSHISLGMSFSSAAIYTLGPLPLELPVCPGLEVLVCECLGSGWEASYGGEVCINRGLFVSFLLACNQHSVAGWFFSYLLSLRRKHAQSPYHTVLYGMWDTCCACMVRPLHCMYLLHVYISCLFAPVGAALHNNVLLLVHVSKIVSIHVLLSKISDCPMPNTDTSLCYCNYPFLTVCRAGARLFEYIPALTWPQLSLHWNKLWSSN